MLNGAAPEALQAELHYDVSESEMLAGGRLNAALLACLARDGLAGWFDTTPETPHG